MKVGILQRVHSQPWSQAQRCLLVIPGGFFLDFAAHLPLPVRLGVLRC